MDNTTIKRLNQLNQIFYQITADSFDQTRGQPWPGWEPLLPYLKTPLSVLDVGCGNGRFGVFLAQHLDITYYGMDSSSELLDRARTALSGVNPQLELRDILEQPPDSGQFDLVVLFGVLHHIPAYNNRQQFMRTLAERVAPGGLFAFAAWRFYEFSRFKDRIVPWPDNYQVESHDYLLDWRRDVQAIRYCHYVDDTEHAALIAATGLTEITSYRADGRSGNINRYSILRREIS
jgi:SAM-dependent methyltransferase